MSHFPSHNASNMRYKVLETQVSPFLPNPQLLFQVLSQHAMAPEPCLFYIRLLGPVPSFSFKLNIYTSIYPMEFPYIKTLPDFGVSAFSPI